ncbi:MAG: MFS transporter [Acidimicrobiales bacterium]
MTEPLTAGLTTDEVAAAAVGDPPVLVDHVAEGPVAPAARRGIARLLSEPMWVLGLVILMDEVDKNIVRGMITPIQDEFGVSDFAIGVLLACSLLVSGIITVPAGYLADRWVRTRAIGWTVVVWSGITALGGAALSFPMLVGIRSALGFGQATTEPSAASLLGDYYPPDERGKAFSIQQVMAIAGGGIGIALGGAMSALFNWRIGMLVAAIPALGVAALAFRLREPKRGTADLMAAIGGGTVEDDVDEHPPLFEDGFKQFLKDMVGGLRDDMKTVLSIRTMRYACVGVAALLFTVTAILAWLGPYYERQLNFAQGQGEAIVGLLVLFGGVPGVLLGGRVADRWAPKMQGGRLALPAIFLFVGTTAFTAAYLFRAPEGSTEVVWSVAGPAIVLQLIGVFVMTMSLPGLRAGLTDAIPAHLRGAGFGAFNLAAVVGGQAAAPLLVGLISGSFDDNLRVAFLAVTPLSFLGAGILFHARKYLDEDMNKIMMAVLQALQDERDREAERAAELERPAT